MSVFKEITDGEKRVAITPEGVAKLAKLDYGQISVQKGAGVAANFTDEQYRAAGARVTDCVYSNSNLILKIREPSNKEMEAIKPNSTLVSFIQPAQNDKLMDQLVEKNITAFALDQIPRVTIAQACDVLSSQENGLTSRETVFAC